MGRFEDLGRRYKFKLQDNLVSFRGDGGLELRLTYRGLE